MWCCAYSTLEEQHSANIGSLHSGLPIYQVKPYLFKNLKKTLSQFFIYKNRLTAMHSFCLRFRRIKRNLKIFTGWSCWLLVKDCRQPIMSNAGCSSNFFVSKKQFKSMLVDMASTMVTKSIF